MDAGAAGGSVQDEAGKWMKAVGNRGTLILCKRVGWIGVAGGRHVEVGECQRRSQSRCKGQGDILFADIISEAGTAVRAAVCRVEQDQIGG